MGTFKINWRRAALLFTGWTLVGVIFAAISYAAAIGENNKEFGFVSALRLNLVQFYLWAILSPLLFRFSRHFPIEFRPLNLRNLLLYHDRAARRLPQINPRKFRPAADQP